MTDHVTNGLIISQRECRTLVENCPYGIIRVDRELRYLYVNSAWETMFGIKAKDVIGTTWRKRGMPEAFCKLWEEQYELVAQTGKNIEFDTPYPSTHGISREFRICIIPEKESTGEITTFQVVIREITGEKQAEERFLKAFGLNPCMMTITSYNEGCIIDVNKSFLDITGYTRDQVLGRRASEIGIWPREGERAAFAEYVKRHGVLRSFEHRFRTKQGIERIAMISSDIISLGDTRCHLTVYQDVTDQKESEHLFSKAFHSNPGLMFIISLDDNRYIDVNNSFAEAVGRERLEIIGKTVDEFNLWVDPKERQEVRQMISDCGKVSNHEIKYRYREKEVRTALLSSETIFAGARKCAISIMTDITDKKRLETEIARFESLNAVAELAAGIGHEVRNPMTTVRGYLQLFRRLEKFAEYGAQLDTMVEELDRANTIITDFLSLAKDKAAELKPGNLNNTVQALYPLLQAEAFRQNHDMRAEVGQVPAVAYDDKEIRQLILNLVRNGMEAMTKPGTITIKTYTDNQDVVLTIRDTGDGIPPEVLERIGTPFLTTKEGGTGLGLSVCYRIAQRHQAKIEVESSSQGTCFRIRFPEAGSTPD